MIDHLNKNYETVEYQEETHLRLYTDVTHSEDFPLHWHNEIEIIHVNSESLLVRCQGFDYKLQKGDTLFICPAAIHEIYNPPVGDRFYIQADMSGFTQLKELNALFSLMSPAVLVSPDLFPNIFNNINDQIKQIKQISLNATASRNSNLHTAHTAEYSEQSSYIVGTRALPFMSEIEVYSHLFQCLAMIGREIQLHSTESAISTSETPLANGQRAMQEACNFIATHFHEALTLEMVAKQIGFSKFYFERLFKQFANMTFYQYVIKCRLSYAQQLLADRSLSITDIATRSGFSGVSTFTRSFRQVTGLTPSEYRQIKEEIPQS